MTRFPAELQWIDEQHDRLCELLVRWSQINTGTYNLPGLAQQLEALEEAFEPLGGEMRRHALAPQQVVGKRGELMPQPLGEALAIVKRPELPRQVFLGIHMDTVYGRNDPFQETRRLDDHRLNGPGVADAKGGLLVMLTALSALERSDVAQRIGWRVLINPDEEVGSPGSDVLLREMARQCDAGLVFEPALPDGRLISGRKGSGNFTVVVRGHSSHAGRDFHAGRNAITAMAHLVTALSELSGTRRGLTVNIANVRGGGPTNIVPDLAIMRFNVRLTERADLPRVESDLRHIVANVNDAQGIEAELHGGFFAPPKPFDPATQQLFAATARCGEALGLSLSWQESGGVCDGNRLNDAGLPTIDTLGVVGGAIHSSQEYVDLRSLTERSRLAAMLLLNLAAGDLDWPNRADKNDG